MRFHFEVALNWLLYVTRVQEVTELMVRQELIWRVAEDTHTLGLRRWGLLLENDDSRLRVVSVAR